jgi:hypothetical protein
MPTRRLPPEQKNRQPLRTSGDKSGHSDEVKSWDQATSAPAWAKAIPTPKKIVLPMIAPKILLPKVFMPLSMNLLLRRSSNWQSFVANAGDGRESTTVAART